MVGRPTDRRVPPSPTPHRFPERRHRGAASPQAPTSSLRPEDFKRPGRCVRARTRETKTNARRRPRRGGAGDSLREVKGGRGSAPRPHQTVTPRRVAAPTQGHRSPADDLPFVSRVARPPNVLVFVPMVRPGHPPAGLPDGTCPFPGLRGRRVAATPLLLRSPSGVLRRHHRGCLRHICTPCEATARLSRTV